MVINIRMMFARAADRRRYANQMAVAECVMRDRRALLASLAHDGQRP